jgi:hypothetical protein
MRIRSRRNRLLALAPAPRVFQLTCAAAEPGSETTLPLAQFYNPEAVAIDGAGNLFVADSHNHTIRKLTRAGTNWVSSTIAGSLPWIPFLIFKQAAC